MARTKNTDFFSSLRSQGIRKRVARALDDLERGGRDARGGAEKLARRVINDLRAAADAIEKRLDLDGAGTRTQPAQKAAKTRRRTAAKSSTAATKGATKRATTSSARKSTSTATRSRKSS
jgi:hypothetical protein